MQNNEHNEHTMMNCAMNMGLIVGAYYIVKFCLFPLSMHSTFAAMLFFGLTMMVPFLVYRLVKVYKDRYAGGNIDFTRAFSFALLVMAFGSLLASVAHYVYFEFIDNGLVVNTLAANIEELAAVDLGAIEGIDTAEGAEAVEQYTRFLEMMNTTLHQLQAMSSIKMTVGMLSNNVSWAFIVALPIALVASMRKKEQ